MRRLPALLAALLFVGAACSSKPSPREEAEPKQAVEVEARSVAPFTIAVMGDNRGEILPCGCKDNPRGGLPRRATYLAQLREEAPLLLLDSGDALFEDPFRRSERAAARAELILESMAELGTAAMAVGDRDLTEGVDWLVSRAEKAGLQLLSANLRTEDGARPFGNRAVFGVGEAKLGVFGIFGTRAGMRIPANLIVEDASAAASEQVEALRKEGADLILALVHGPNDLIRTIAQIPGVEIVVPSHDGSISFPYRPNPEAAWIVAGGQLGRTLTTIRLQLDGPGRLQDAGAVAQVEDERRGIGENLQVARARFESSRPGSQEREAFAEQIRHLQHRDVELGKRIEAMGEVKGRRFYSEQRSLGADVPDEPKMAAKVAAFEASAK